jgi:MoaA/NifB/PqqE/SkfB family radical SAM enzyme
MDIAAKLKAMGVKTVYSYINRDPKRNLPKVLDWLEKHDDNNAITSQVQAVRTAIIDPKNNWSQLLNSLWTDINNQQRKILFTNAIINGSMIGAKLQNETRAKYDCNVPWAILMDPTSACNLHCIGCWAAEYGDKMNLSLEQLDDIICQGKAHGTYIYIYSGGEPLIRKKDIIRLCEKHRDCAFLAFTNGTLIDDEFTDEMLRVGNFVPAISVEGFEAATDSRRGKGTYQAVISAMQRLREKKLLFGISCCYTSENTEVIGSEKYFDSMIDLGAKFAWLFTYMPIGADAVPELLASAEQREFMYHQIRKFRNEKPIFTMDFWNDGEFVNGCIAGGRNYMHINANGDIEPCAFIHYADSNIKVKTLLEAYQSPLFQAYKANQPFNANMLRPCPVLDNPGRLTEMVESSGAHSTDMASPEQASDYCDRCVQVAERWAVVADRLWKEHPHGKADR